jgi:hypothetical protein
MSHVFLNFQLGLKVIHHELGDGVVVGREPTGYVTVFFRSHGERQVPADSLQITLDRFDQIIQNIATVTPERVERLWLALEAEEIPLMESAATLTSAKVDLLPHQVVLVHRLANARPKRFLIADEVGLGKTIEAGLVLQELILRHRVRSVLIACPSSLQIQWKDEMRDKFGLEFRIIDSDTISQLRRRRGIHVNPILGHL